MTACQTSTLSSPAKAVTVLPPPPLHIQASFSVGNTPEVEKAYRQFTKTGIAKTVSAAGFKTFAYEAYSRPIITCAPLRLCVIQLEQGETINNIDLGDSERWLLSTSMVGSTASGSYQITLKPKSADLATDLIITTNQRTYNMGLVSQAGAISEVVNFYYLTESLKAANENLTTSLGDTSGHGEPLSLQLLNFNYSIQGAHVAWLPERAFDDGAKTFIQLPATVAHGDLPVVYVKRGHDLQLVNYRYQSPHFIVDGVFKTLELVGSHGRASQTVTLHNASFND